MITLARENPFFVLPLPRAAGASENDEKIRTDEYEMFYLQWLFHPTPDTAPPSSEASSSGGTEKPLPPTSSAIFTPLEEFKKAGEWAQPFLVLTHYPNLSNTHGTVLMRGEISPASATGPVGSDLNPGYLLSQQQAQLLALALQRFYCADISVSGESQRAWEDRKKRKEALKGFRENPGEWDWSGLVTMAYGGML
jgi:ATP synthase F1 complex assembly factor 1